MTNTVQGKKDAYTTVIPETRPPGFPFGNDIALISNLWRRLVADASMPAVRCPNITPVPYPSSIGGSHLLKQVLAAHPAWPAQGAAAWENWAVFFFAALMAAQPFPDGNKRISRVVYALTLLGGGVPFKAPTDVYGGRLAGMLG